MQDRHGGDLNYKIEVVVAPCRADMVLISTTSSKEIQYCYIETNLVLAAVSNIVVVAPCESSIVAN